MLYFTEWQISLYWGQKVNVYTNAYIPTGKLCNSLYRLHKHRNPEPNTTIMKANINNYVKEWTAWLVFNNYQSIYENCPALFTCGVTKVLIHNSQITVQQYRLVAERIKLASIKKCIWPALFSFTQKSIRLWIRHAKQQITSKWSALEFSERKSIQNVQKNTLPLMITSLNQL